MAKRTLGNLFGILASALLLASAGSAFALETDRPYGEASFKFLKLPLSPRIVGLGGAGVALADGAAELDLNPAAPAADSASLVVGKGFPFGEFQAGSSHITWSVPYDGYRILLNARYLGFDKIDGHDEQAQSTSAYGAHTLKAQAGVAGRLHKLDWGATLNFAENSIASANYTTAMVNAGVRYAVLTGLHAGFSVLNADFYGSKAKDGTFQDPFPPTAIQAGLSYAHAIGGNFAAALAVDARTRNDEELNWPVGGEVSWRDIIYARAGFPFGAQEPGFHGGVGLRWSIFALQYAYEGHANLGPGHFWELEVHY